MNVKPNKISNLNILRMTLSNFSIHGCLNSIQEILDFEEFPNPWALISLNCARNNIPCIDPSIVIHFLNLFQRIWRDWGINFYDYFLLSIFGSNINNFLLGKLNSLKFKIIIFFYQRNYCQI